MSDTTHIVATISPKAGKFDRVQELLQKMVDNVHQKEADTSRYHAHKTLDKEPPMIVMVETYKTKAHADKHVQTDYFNEFAKTLQEEDLLSEPPMILQCQDLIGFESR